MKNFLSYQSQSSQNDRASNDVLLSGLKGKALNITLEDIPSRSEVRASLPKECFTRQTKRSLFYLVQTLTIQFFVVLLGIYIPKTINMSPIWILYSLISGTTAMGMWVLAHECGHGAFSDNRRLQTFVGYCLHSFLLVPYFSWQRSHSVHHAYTNHISDGETHVPLVIRVDGKNEKAGGEEEMASSLLLGRNLYGLTQLVLHLIFGWPAYLLAGKTGGPRYGTTNHFWPIAPFSRKLWPSTWAKKVWLSDWGILLVILFLILWAIKYGLFSMICIYGGPLLVVNIWLVVYTWLHHTDTDVPHLAGDEFSYMRGAFLSIDRPYGKVLDFLHHSIGSTHVIHHIEPTVPHYHARLATRILKDSFPQAYLYNPSPIYKSLWNVAQNCVAVRKDPKVDRYIWQQPR